MSQRYQNLYDLYGGEIRKLYFDERLSQEAIDKKLKLSRGTTGNIMRFAGMKARSDREQALKYTCNEHYFDIIDTEEKAYWLGMMYTDGYITKPRKHSNYKIGLALHSRDTPHLEKFKNALNTNARIATYKQTTTFGETEFSRLLISSPLLAEGLISKGCTAEKTYSLHFPTEETVPQHLMRHFIRGCIDGDGALIRAHNPNGVPNYALQFTGTFEMVEGIKHFLEADHIKNDQRHKNRDNNNYSLKIGGNRKAFAAFDMLYDNCTIYLDRKYQKYLEYKQEYNEYFSRVKQ